MFTHFWIDVKQRGEIEIKVYYNTWA